MYLKLSSSLLPPGRLRSILESGWDETGCVSARCFVKLCLQKPVNGRRFASCDLAEPF